MAPSLLWRADESSFTRVPSDLTSTGAIRLDEHIRFLELAKFFINSSGSNGVDCSMPSAATALAVSAVALFSDSTPHGASWPADVEGTIFSAWAFPQITYNLGDTLALGRGKATFSRSCNSSGLDDPSIRRQGGVSTA